MHVNEQTVESVKKSLVGSGFESRVEIDDYFVMFSNPFLFFYYLIAQPFYIQFLTRIFGEHIWAISYKKPTLRLEKEEKYLTIPKNFSGDDYYRFYKLNLIVQEIIKGNS